jgi:hypothetical protein
MTIREIFEQYTDLQIDVKAGDVTPADALIEISKLQAQADAINAGFTFTQNLDDLKALVDETPSGNDSEGYTEDPPSYEESSY